MYPPGDYSPAGREPQDHLLIDFEESTPAAFSAQSKEAHTISNHSSFLMTGKALKSDTSTVSLSTFLGQTISSNDRAMHEVIFPISSIKLGPLQVNNKALERAKKDTIMSIRISEKEPEATANDQEGTRATHLLKAAQETKAKTVDKGRSEASDGTWTMLLQTMEAMAAAIQFQADKQEIKVDSLNTMVYYWHK
ncbi:hypothetical protein NDU88_002407 [Pleurodeles waltl]|uniref:Uncharacterized protein n=1 Tax=Pleurodeles waltl TaxID=8319 RepID=A0AAV7M1E0_PLEWA|nr:hypothetical protein NDU88_002407 [Pleurodeles waltl]